MYRSVVVLLLSLWLLPHLPAQGLINSLPADTLVYIRSEGGLDDLQQFAGGNGIWNSPLDLNSSVFEQMDKGLAQLGETIGVEAGSIRTYIRSMKGMEAALFRFSLADGLPEFDYAIAFETPQADEIFKLASGALVKQAFGEMTDDNSMEVPIDGDIGLHIAQQNDKIIIASDAARLRETMASFGKVVPGNLAQTKEFKAVVGTAKPKGLFYCRLGFLMELSQDLGRQMEREFGGRGARDGFNAEARDETWRALGMHRLHSFGYNETETNTRIAMVAEGTVIPFKMLAARGTAELLAALPADTAFGITWAGNVLEVWNLFAENVVTNPRLQFAPFVAERVRAFQKESGLKVEQVAEIFDRGIVLGVVPDRDGEIDEDPVIIARTSDPAKARSVAQQLMDKMSPEITEGLPNMYDEGETTFVHPRGRRRKRAPIVALDGDAIFVGPEEIVRKSINAYRGQAPTLRSIGAVKGLKPNGSAYMYLQFQPIFAQGREFAAAYGNLLPGAGMAATMTFTENAMTMTTSRRISETFATFGLAAAQQEVMRGKQRACEANLKAINEAYDLYLGQHSKHPTSLAQLGFSGEKALVCPLDIGDTGTRKPYRLFPGEKTDEGMLLRACCDHVSHGRLALDREGNTRRLSQVKFAQMLRETLAAGSVK